MDRKTVAATIEHTLLKPDASPRDVEKLCAEAKEYGFFGVCVNPCYVSLCHDLLAGSMVKVVCVISFPLGADETAVKEAAVAQALRSGADEVDMVMNLGLFKAGEYPRVEADIAAVVKAAAGHIVKVIIEAGLLTDREIVTASRLCVAAGAQFVKTSTGLFFGGASLHHVGLIRETVGTKVRIKASGGIKTPQQATEFISAGVARIGTSNGVQIIRAMGEEFHAGTHIIR